MNLYILSHMPVKLFMMNHFLLILFFSYCCLNRWYWMVIISAIYHFQ